MAGVPRVLLDHVDQHLAERDQVRLTVAADGVPADVEVGRSGNQVLRERDLGPPGGPGAGNRAGSASAPLKSPSGSSSLLYRGAAAAAACPARTTQEPVLLRLGQMPDQPEQAQVRWRHRSGAPCPRRPQAHLSSSVRR